MRATIATLALACATLTAAAQDTAQPVKAFGSMDLGVTMGTTGIGIDVEAPLGRYVNVRTGLEYMPRVEQHLHFDIQSFDNNGSLLESRFDKMAEVLEQFTGYKASPQVDMVGKPTFWNFKLLFDVFPFRNRHWHVTAGFHWGPSDIAEAINALSDAPSLVSVNMYNHLYTQVMEGENAFGDFDLTGDQRRMVRSSGRMGIHVGTYKDRYITETVYDDEGNEGTEYVLDANGNRIRQPYYMEPDADCTVSARVTVNSFKPYLGFGYSGRLVKGDDRYHIGFDAGLMFWGGTPAVITHDGTNLSKDVTDIGGKVGDYVDLISGVKAYPVLNLRITRKLF